MKRLLSVLLLCAAPAFAQENGWQEIQNGWGEIQTATGAVPAGCVAGRVPIFLGSPVALGCDAGLTYDAANARFKVNGGGTGGEALYRVQIAMGAAPGYGLTISNGAIDPWFHVNSSGVGFVGDGTTIPFYSIESNPAMKRELRSEITADAADPGGYAMIWAKATDHAASPMSLFLRADNDIVVQAGTSNAVADNTGAVHIAGTGGVTAGAWPAGTGWLSASASGTSVIGPLTVSSGTGDVVASSVSMGGAVNTGPTHRYDGSYLISTAVLDWSSSTTNPFLMDTGLARLRAGVVKVTNGSTGSGNLNVGIPAYANNAAALSGGLVAGDLYYTDSAGEYVVKVAH